MIPRARRLRRRVRVWTTIRAAAACGGAWFIWRFIYAGAGAGYLVFGLLLLVFGLLVSARPEAKSVDAQAREFNALVVLNGGTFVPPQGGKPSRGVRIFVNPERLFVLDERDRALAEIPLAAVRHLVARAAVLQPASGGAGKLWQLEVSWERGDVHTVTFRFEGFFAEHLARVAETTLRNVMKKDLPVLRA